MKKIPGNIYVAGATRLGDGRFHAVRSGPGIPPAAVHGADGSPTRFASESDAEQAAFFDLLSAMNAVSGGASGYVAKAQRASAADGYVGIWGAPGLAEAVLRDRPGSNSPAIFATESEAKLAAIRNLLNVLNKPRARAATSNSARQRYQKMTAAEFAEALRACNLAPSFFAFLYGTTDKRVLAWLDGSEDVPHPARVLLTLFANPSNVDLAEDVTDRITTERVPARDNREN